MEKQFEKPMKWYKFVIYFQLFAAAVFNVGAGIIFFTGSHYGLDSFELKLFYGVLSNLKTLDICMGIVSIFLAVFAIIVRQKLAHFDEQGPKLYLSYQLITVGANLLYIVKVMYGICLPVHMQAAEPAFPCILETRFILTIEKNTLSIMELPIYRERKM